MIFHIAPGFDLRVDWHPASGTAAPIFDLLGKPARPTLAPGKIT